MRPYPIHPIAMKLRKITDKYTPANVYMKKKFLENPPDKSKIYVL